MVRFEQGHHVGKRRGQVFGLGGAWGRRSQRVWSVVWDIRIVDRARLGFFQFQELGCEILLF